jgi:hypothetical protein
VAAALRLPVTFAAGEHALARRHAEAAIATLLARADRAQHARWLCGERDPLAGSDPWAALAAMPWRCDLQLAIAKGDAAGVAAATAAVREFAGHDAATLASLPAVVEVNR